MAVGALAALGWGLAVGAAAAGGQLLAPALAARTGAAGCLLVAWAWLVACRRAQPSRQAYVLWFLLWGGFAGLALAGWTTGRREASLEALALPRLAWVAGVAQREWERRWDTAWMRLGSVRLLEERCPGPDEGRPLVGALQLEAAWELARAVPVMAGQRVCARVVVRRPPQISATGTFPMRDYLQARGVVAVARVRSPERIRLVGADSRGVSWRLRLWARFQHHLVQEVAAPLGRRAGPRAERWFRAVALGQDQFLTTAERVELRGSGLAHLTSVSGMHVGLVAGPVALAARYLRRPAWQGVARAAAVAFGWVYAGATGMESPAVRAVLMQATALVVGLGGWRAHPLVLVGWACALQLLHNPWLARDVGFQLSYAATAGIAMASRWQAVLAPAAASRPVGAQRAGPAVGVVRGAAGALLVSLGAWSASAPVVARRFGGVSPWGIGASVLSAPVALGLVWGGFAGGLLPAPLDAPGAMVARASAWLLAGIARGAARAAQRWPIWWGTEGFGVAAALVAAVWMSRRAVSAGRVLAGVGAGAAALASRFPAAGPARPVAVGYPLGAGGWLWVAGQGGDASWAVIRPGAGGDAVSLAGRFGQALAQAGVRRVVAVVWWADEPPAPHVRLALGPAAARAALLRPAAGSWLVWTDSTQGWRVVEGSRVRAGKMRLGWVFDGGGRLLRIEPLPDRPSRDGLGGMVVSVDGRGCLFLSGRQSAPCAGRAAARMELAGERRPGP